MATVASAITRVKRSFPSALNATILEYFQEVEQDLDLLLDFKEDTEDVNLTAGTYEYALDVDILKVTGAELRKSATDVRPMRAIEKSDLRGAWRDAERRDPSRFYLARNNSGVRVVGFDGIPPTTTSAGYPIARLYVTRGITLTDVGNLNSGIRSVDTYVFGACWRLAPEFKPEMTDYWRKLYEGKKTEEFQLAWGSNTGSAPSIQPLPFGGNVGPV